MSWISKIFGGSGPKAEEAPEVVTEYQGFRIVPVPIGEGQIWRISARIEKDLDGEVKVHTLVRADTLQDRDQAVTASLAKARQVIDEQGDALFR